MSAPIGNTNGFKKGMTPWNKGKKWLDISGINHPNWKEKIKKICKCGKSFLSIPSQERVKYCSKECYWKNKHDIPWNKGTKGLMPIPWSKGKSNSAVLGDKNINWKGDNVSYGSLHAWVRRKLGRVKECTICGSEEHIEWASISHKAKRDLDDYFPLCITCHRKYDSKGGLNFGYAI